MKAYGLWNWATVWVRTGRVLGVLGVTPAAAPQAGPVPHRLVASGVPHSALAFWPSLQNVAGMGARLVGGAAPARPSQWAAPQSVKTPPPPNRPPTPDRHPPPSCHPPSLELPPERDAPGTPAHLLAPSCHPPSLPPPQNVNDMATYIIQVAVVVMHIGRLSISSDWLSILASAQCILLLFRLQYFSRQEHQVSVEGGLGRRAGRVSGGQAGCRAVLPVTAGGKVVASTPSAQGVPRHTLFLPGLLEGSNSRRQMV